MLKPINAPRLINHAIEQNQTLKRNMSKASNNEEMETIQRRIASNNVMIKQWKGGK